MAAVLCTGCAATGKALIRATGKEIQTAQLLPQKNVVPPKEDAFPLLFGPFNYKSLPAREVGTYQFSSGVIRDIILDADPAPVLEKLVRQELGGKGIRNLPSILTLKGSVKDLHVNGDRSSPQSFSGEVSIDLAVHNEKTGKQVWARSYRGSGSAQEPQVALAAAFRALALFITADNSILDLRDIFFASGDKKPPQGVTSGKAPPHDEIASLPAKPAIEKKTPDARPNKIPPTITIISPEVKRGVNLLSRQNSVTIIGRATAANGMAQVTVNGDAVTLDDQGNFSTDILLKPGENRFVVMAADVLNNQKTERFTIVRRGEKISRPVDEQAFVSSPGKMRYFALIIGINNYRNLDRLKTAVNDARTVAQVLKDDYGFETALLLNEQATRDGIMKELNMLRKKLTSRDKLLIYYAGHGDYNKETDTAYWMPVNAERDDNTNWIESKSISDQLKLISARHILVVSDSCYSGTLTRSAVTNLSGNDTRDIYLRKLEEKTSRILISSGGNEPVSDSGGKTHSIFADVFIKALKKAEKDIFTAEELHTLYIKESVAGRTAQTPEYKVIRNSGHDGGDFIFVKRK